MDESGLHCASTFSPSSSMDSGGRRWLMMGTQGFTYLKKIQLILHSEKGTYTKE